MKLKRFLLRYEPPGVGLDIEDDTGSTAVTHKNLPATCEVSTADEIRKLVDDLIAEESQLLTGRKHRSTLVQLLGRLYQVDVSEETAAQPTPRGDAGASNDVPETPRGPREGQQVVLCGLSNKQQVYNGEVATVTRTRGEKHKYEVVLGCRGEPGDLIKVKGIEHMALCAAKTPLSVGLHVVIRGLRNHVELNGCLGRIVECHEESHRFEVRATESGQLFRVKQENLVAIEVPTWTLQGSSGAPAAKENREPNTAAVSSSGPRLKKDAPGAASTTSAVAAAAAAAAVNSATNAIAGAVSSSALPGSEPDVGSKVQLHGLKTASCFNGQTAEVLSVDKAKGRYEIRLGDGSVKTIRSENVQLLAPAAGGEKTTSPRKKKS